jgi:hypothetical protein
MAKNVLQVSIACRIKIVARDFCFNLDMENRHFNILIQK